MKTIEVLGKPAGFNKCLNGNFDFWQRGSSFTGLSTSTYTVDRFRHSTNLATGTSDVNRDTDIPNEASLYSMKIDVNVAQSSIGAGELYAIDHIIEGYNSLALYNKTISMSFWVKSNKVGTYCIPFRNGVSFNRTYVKEYTINSINTWEQKHITIPHEVVGTWNKDNSSGIIIAFCLAVGSNNFLSPNTWHSANGLSTSNQVNFFDNASNYINFSQMMVYEGRGLTDQYYMFGGDITNELAACQRYYESLILQPSLTYAGSLATQYWEMHPWNVTKRASPSVSVTNFSMYNNGGSTGVFTPNTLGGNATSFYVGSNVQGYSNLNGILGGTIIGDAEYQY